MRITQVMALLWVVWFSVVACGRNVTVQGNFVGRVAGTDAFVAVVTDGETAIGYVCDGQGISEWFEGTVTGDALNLTSPGGAELTATLAHTGVKGSFTAAAGETFNFTADAAAAPAGLFRLDDTIAGEPYKGGWIILPNGEQRGTLTTSEGAGCTATNTCPPLENTGSNTPPKLILPNGSQATVPRVDFGSIPQLFGN